METVISQQQEHIAILKKELDNLRNPEHHVSPNMSQDSPANISILGDASFNFGVLNELTPKPLLLSSRSKELPTLETSTIPVLSIKIPVKPAVLSATQAFRMFDLPNHRSKPGCSAVGSQTMTPPAPTFNINRNLHALERSVPIKTTRDQESLTEPLQKEIVEVITEVVREVIIREKETKEYMSLSTMTEQRGQGVVKISPFTTLQKYAAKLASVSLQTEPKQRKDLGSQTDTPPKPTLTLNTNKPQFSLNPSPKPSPILSAGKVFNFNFQTGLGNSQTSFSSGGSPPKDQSALVTKLEGKFSIYGQAESRSTKKGV